MQLLSNQPPANTGQLRALLHLCLPLLTAGLLLGSCKKDDTSVDTSAYPLLHIVSPVEGTTVMPGAPGHGRRARLQWHGLPHQPRNRDIGHGDHPNYREPQQP